MAITEERKNKTFISSEVWVPKGEREVISSHAESQGESLNAFIRRAIAETMERDNNK